MALSIQVIYCANQQDPAKTLQKIDHTRQLRHEKPNGERYKGQLSIHTMEHHWSTAVD